MLKKCVALALLSMCCLVGSSQTQSDDPEYAAKALSLTSAGDPLKGS